MTTPAFLPQDPSSFPAIRYYTPFDPYHYTVDNRPIQDIATVLAGISQGGGDSGRRAALITQLNLSQVFPRLSGVGDRYFTGFTVGTPGANSVTIGAGAVYEIDSVSVDSGSMIVKQALKLQDTTFQVNPPTGTGQAVDYLIQVETKDLTSANMATSQLPYLDSTNQFLPGLLLSKEAVLTIKAGAAAPIGNQVPPALDPNCFGLYVVTTISGSSVPTVETYAQAPRSNGIKANLSLYASSATQDPVYGPQLISFGPDASTVASTQIDISKVNPLIPIKISFTYYSPGNTGGAIFNLEYSSFKDGGDGTTPTTAGVITESVPAVPAAGSLDTYTFQGEIPTSAFAAFVSGVWTTTASVLNLRIERDGAHTSDSLISELYVRQVKAYQ